MVAQVNPPESLYSVRNIPYSSASVLDLGGLGVRRYGPIEVKIAPADWADFQALLQASDELIVNDTTYARATLISLSNHVITPRGEWHFVTAEFIVG
jgi:hypothetical protein